MGHDSLNACVSILIDLEGAVEKMSDNTEYLDELTKVNNELANVSRELAKKNAQIEETKRLEIERARLLEGRTFSAAIAHMMNNIMMTISGSVDLIEMQQDLDNEGKKRIAAIRDAIKRSSKLIDRLLLVTHMDKGAIVPFELDRVVTDVIDGLEVNGESVELKLGASGQIAAAHENLVRIAIQELVSNGIEASNDVSRRPVTVETRSDDEHSTLLVAVSNQGHDIPAEIAERIHLPFVTSRFLGRGLGLTLAKHAADACGGELNWHREEGITTFTFLMPRNVDRRHQ